MNTLDREYIGRQAEEIKQLQVENKALKSSRDELLGLVRGYLVFVTKNEDSWGLTEEIIRTLNNSIEKAEAQKEKETK